MEQQEISKAATTGAPAPTPLDDPHRTSSTGMSRTEKSGSLTRLFVAEWDAITGLVAAAIVLIIHWLHSFNWIHIGAEVPLLPLAVGLIAILFIRLLRQEPRTKRALAEVHRSHALLRDIRKRLDEQESLTTDAHAAANERLTVLRSIESKQVTPQHLRTHNLCFKIDQIEQSLGNTLISAKWEETRENIDYLAQGRVIVRNRADIFTYKVRGLKTLNEDEEFRSTVIPMDLDPPAAYEDDHFERYQEEIFEFAARCGERQGHVRRLYIFRDQQQFDEPNHQKHMQRMADHGVEVRYLIVSRSVQNESTRDRIMHKDYAIFGERSYVRLDTDKRRSVIETDQKEIAEAIKDFESLWVRDGSLPLPRTKQEHDEP